MKKKFKIIDAASGEKLKLGERRDQGHSMLVMNNQGIFFIIGNFMDYDTYVRKLSDVCPRFEVQWKGEE